jgi:FtsP/CotA-like multicopper oxidase with cupredoxin domain
MPKDRRSFFTRLAGWGAAAASAGGLRAQRAPVLVKTPDVPKLPWKMVDGVKEFHLIAEPVHKELMPGRPIDVWGFNGSMPGPTIEANEGDRVRFVFENRLPELTAVHWHGLEVPIEMDGVPGISMDPVPPGGTFTYEFTLNQHGSFFYHSHMPMQEMLGMIGWFIIHPREDYDPPVDRDYAYVLQEFALLPNNTVPNTLSMEFNWLTMNGKSGPDITPVLCKPGERVRLRFVNMGMDHHPMHMHGHQWMTTGTEGGRIPEAAWAPGNTVLVGVAQVRTVEFVAKYVGDWMLHCHLPHHMMNQMVSMVGPMTSGPGGMQAGLGMNEGMGMIHRGGAAGDGNGPSLGRGMGLAADHDTASSAFVHQGHETSEEAKTTPGFPQDMWMPMDHLVAHKPDNHGLRKDWTASMMGMMTLIRVLEPEMFDRIAELKRQAEGRA